MAGAARLGMSARWTSGTGRRRPKTFQRATGPRSLPTGSGAYVSLGTSGWMAYLRGEQPTYPEQALQWDLDLLDKRLAAMRRDATPPERRLADNMLDYNPAAAESLVQLMWGALMPGRNGGLVNARLRYFNPERRRAGVPEDVAALVSGLSDTRTTVTLVNLNPSQARRVVVQGGAYGEHLIESVSQRHDDHADPGAALHRAARSWLRRDADPDHAALRDDADRAPSLAPGGRLACAAGERFCRPA